MKPTILHLKSLALRNALSDFVTMQRWEILRRAPHRLSASQLADACGTTQEEAQRSLDLLAEAGLVVPSRATARMRQITYRAISEHVLFQADESAPDQARFLVEGQARIRRYSRGLIDGANRDAVDPRARGISLEGYLSLMLTADEARDVRQALRQAWSIVSGQSKRAWLDARDGGPAERRPRFPFHLSLVFAPLSEAVLPLPEAGTWTSRAVAEEADFVAKSPEAVLSPQELRIAQLLSAGRSRPEIAAKLRLSLNTISSTTKRVYAKLGVRNRAQLAGRMRGA